MSRMLAVDLPGSLTELMHVAEFAASHSVDTSRFQLKRAERGGVFKQAMAMTPQLRPRAVRGPLFSWG
jgi:hypothetical protein